MGWFNSVIDEIGDFAEDVADGVQGFVDAVVDVVEAVVDFVGKALGPLGEVLAALAKVALSIAKALANGIITISRNMWRALRAILTGDWDALEEAIGLGKDGWLTNMVQDYIPFGGLVTAAVHSMAGNNNYAEYAATVGLGSGVEALASTAGSLGGPWGAALGSAAGSFARSAIEGGLRGELDPDVAVKIPEFDLKKAGKDAFTSGVFGGLGATKRGGRVTRRIKGLGRRALAATPIPRLATVAKRLATAGKGLAGRAANGLKGPVRRAGNGLRRLVGKPETIPPRIGPGGARLTPTTHVKDLLAPAAPPTRFKRFTTKLTESFGKKAAIGTAQELTGLFPKSNDSSRTLPVKDPGPQALAPETPREVLAAVPGKPSAAATALVLVAIVVIVIPYCSKRTPDATQPIAAVTPLPPRIVRSPAPALGPGAPGRVVNPAKPIPSGAPIPSATPVQPGTPATPGVPAPVATPPKSNATTTTSTTSTTAKPTKTDTPTTTERPKPAVRDWTALLTCVPDSAKDHPIQLRFGMDASTIVTGTVHDPYLDDSLTTSGTIDKQVAQLRTDTLTSGVIRYAGNVTNAYDYISGVCDLNYTEGGHDYYYEGTFTMTRKP